MTYLNLSFAMIRGLAIELIDLLLYSRQIYKQINYFLSSMLKPLWNFYEADLQV